MSSEKIRKYLPSKSTKAHLLPDIFRRRIVRATEPSREYIAYKYNKLSERQGQRVEPGTPVGVYFSWGEFWLFSDIEPDEFTPEELQD